MEITAETGPTAGPGSYPTIRLALPDCLLYFFACGLDLTGSEAMAPWEGTTVPAGAMGVDLAFP